MTKETLNRALTVAHNAGAAGDRGMWWSPHYGPVRTACAAAGRDAYTVSCDAAPGDVWPVNGEAPVLAGQWDDGVDPRF